MQINESLFNLLLRLFSAVFSINIEKNLNNLSSFETYTLMNIVSIKTMVINEHPMK